MLIEKKIGSVLSGIFEFKDGTSFEFLKKTEYSSHA